MMVKKIGITYEHFMSKFLHFYTSSLCLSSCIYEIIGIPEQNSDIFRVLYFRSQRQFRRSASCLTSQLYTKYSCATVRVYFMSAGSKSMTHSHNL